MTALRRSADRKVSPLVRRQKSKDAPVLFNSFGLPAGNGADGSCSGMTSVCESICYANNLERAWSTVARLVRGNFDLLRARGDDIDAMTDLLGEMVEDFRVDCERAVKSGRISWDDAAVFRIHWDGDFYSVAYATAWRNVIMANADIRFWAYTRSFLPECNVVPILADVPNLTLYLSVDVDNQQTALAILATHPTVHAATLADTFDDASTMLADLGRNNAPACPELTGRIPLVAPIRRGAPLLIGDDGRGACTACGLCIRGTADVRFSTEKMAR